MAFGRKNGKSGDGQGTATAPPGGPARGGLRTVVQETTPEVAIERLEQCPAFELPRTPAGERRWLSVMLNTRAIGGLSTKDRRDEDKGALLQQMNGGSLHVVATDEMLDTGFIGFVPDAETIATTAEFGLLSAPAEGKYDWAVFRAGRADDAGSLSIDGLVGPARAGDLALVASGKALRDVVSKDGADPDSWERALASLGGSASDAVTAAQPEAEPPRETAAQEQPYSAQPSATAVDESTGLMPSPFSHQAYAADAVDGLSEAEEDADDSYRQDSYGADDYDDFFDDADQGEPAAVEDTAPQDVLAEPRPSTDDRAVPAVELPADPAALATALGEEALSMPVNLGAIEPLLPDRGPASIGGGLAGMVGAGVSPWLSEQAVILASAADAELAALHRRHLQQQRAAYLDQMHLYVSRFERDLSLHGDGEMAKRVRALDEGRDAAHEAAEESSERVAEKARRRYEAEADQHAAKVAEQARASYLANVDARLRLEAADAVRGMHERADADFAVARAALMEERREVARQLMSRAQAECVTAARNLSARQDEEMAAAVAAHAEALRQAVQTAYTADVERVQVLARQQAIGQEVEVTRQQAEQRVNDLRADYEGRLQAGREAVARATADVERARQDGVATANRLTEGMKEQLASLQTQLIGASQSAEQRVAGMAAQLEASKLAADQARDDFTARVASLQSENDSLRAENSRQRIVGWVLVALSVGIALAFVLAVLLPRLA